MKAICIKTTDPAYNLAVEEALFEKLNIDDMAENGFFLLWQNAPSVIVGRHQNTAEEVNEAYVKENNIAIIRRETGGGAVYHDLGNLNFSFISTLSKGEDTSFAKYITPIATALQSIGFVVEISGRNDMLIEGRKFSGNAKRQSGGKILQHGTLMVNLDTSCLSDILTGNPDKFTSKGIQSHKSRVANLMEFLPEALAREWLATSSSKITVENSCHTSEHLLPHQNYSEQNNFAQEKTRKLIECIQKTLIAHCATEEIELPLDVHERACVLVTQKYSTWEWNFGKSPKFSTKWRKRFTWGALDFYADIAHGKITRCSFYGDFFVNKDIDELEQVLVGTLFNRKSIKACLQKNQVERFFVGAEQQELLDFFDENIL